MILHRLLRQAEMIRDLFVRESFRNQRDNLLLPPRKPKTLRRAAKWQPRFRILKKSKQCRAKLARANRFADMHILDRSCDVPCGSVAPQKSADPSAHKLQKLA